MEYISGALPVLSLSGGHFQKHKYTKVLQCVNSIHYDNFIIVLNQISK